jgi:hypothetical protein
MSVQSAGETGVTEAAPAENVGAAKQSASANQNGTGRNSRNKHRCISARLARRTQSGHLQRFSRPAPTPISGSQEIANRPAPHYRIESLRAGPGHPLAAHSLAAHSVAVVQRTKQLGNYILHRDARIQWRSPIANSVPGRQRACGLAPACEVQMLLDDLDYPPRTRFDEHGRFVDDRVAIIAHAVFGRHIVVSDARFRQHDAGA